jgi:hypothetical protein
VLYFDLRHVLSWLLLWLDLFENMDRKAKLVATELSDESSDLQPPGIDLVFSVHLLRS